MSDVIVASKIFEIISIDRATSKRRTPDSSTETVSERRSVTKLIVAEPIDASIPVTKDRPKIISAARIAAIESNRGLDQALATLGLELGMAGMYVKRDNQRSKFLPPYSAGFYEKEGEIYSSCGLEHNAESCLIDIRNALGETKEAAKAALLNQVLGLAKVISVRLDRRVLLCANWHSRRERPYQIVP